MIEASSFPAAWLSFGRDLVRRGGSANDLVVECWLTWEELSPRLDGLNDPGVYVVLDVREGGALDGFGSAVESLRNRVLYVGQSSRLGRRLREFADSAGLDGTPKSGHWAGWKVPYALKEPGGDRLPGEAVARLRFGIVRAAPGVRDQPCAMRWPELLEQAVIHHVHLVRGARPVMQGGEALLPRSRNSGNLPGALRDALRGRLRLTGREGDADMGPPGTWLAAARVGLPHPEHEPTAKTPWWTFTLRAKRPKVRFYLGRIDAVAGPSCFATLWVDGHRYPTHGDHIYVDDADLPDRAAEVLAEVYVVGTDRPDGKESAR